MYCRINFCWCKFENSKRATDWSRLHHFAWTISNKQTEDGTESRADENGSRFLLFSQLNELKGTDSSNLVSLNFIQIDDVIHLFIQFN